MSHVDFKKYICRPVEFKKCSCCPVEFKKLPCPMSLDFQISCRMSLKGWFHEPTNHDDERDKTANEWKLTKNNRSV